MDTGSSADWVSAVANVIVALAAVAAAKQGIAGLKAWRDEAVGKRRMELAEDALTDFYEAADVIRWARYPVSYGHESADRERPEGETEAVRAHRDTFYPSLKRLNDHAELFSRVRTRRFRVKATFGEDAAKPFEALHAIHSEIVVSAQILMTMNPDARDERSNARWEKHEAVVWGVGEEDDKVAAKVAEVLKAAEAIFRPAIFNPGKPPE